MKTCPTCYKTFVEDNLSFCTACGTPLPSSSQSATGAGNDPGQTLITPPVSEPAPPSPFSDPQPPSWFNDPTPSSPSSMETMIAPPSLFSDPSPSPGSYGGPPQQSYPPSSGNAPQPPPLFNDPSPQRVKPFSEQPTSYKPLSEQIPPQSSPSNDPFQPMLGSQPPPYSPMGLYKQPSQPEWTPPPPPVPNWNVQNPVGTGYVPPSMGPNQNLALASLITGISSVTVGLCCSFGMLLAPVAIVLGIVALVQIKNNPIQNTGKGMAIGGIATGSLYFVLIILLILFNVGISLLPILLGV